MVTPAQPSPLYRFGVYEVDLRRGELRKHGTRVKVQGKPFQVLTVLLERPGEVVAREELRERLWPADTYVQFDDGLNAAVEKLRAALNDSAGRPHYIETIPRRGYRFVAPLTNVAAIGPATAVPTAPPAAVLQEVFTRPPLYRRWQRLAAYALPAAALAASLLFGVHHRTVETHRAESVQEVRLGRELWRHRTAESLTQAVDHYNKALELDSTNAAAYSGLADAYIVLPFLSTIQQNATYPKAKAAAEKAVKLDPSLAEAHTSLADVKLYVGWDFDGTEREFQQAWPLTPTMRRRTSGTQNSCR